MENTTKLRNVHWLIWLGLPVATLILKFVLPLFGYDVWNAIWIGGHDGEWGFVENGTVAILLPAVVLAAMIFIRRKEIPRTVAVLILLLGFGALFFAGEEVSWGQQWFRWDTPEWVKDHNRQDETNIHNMGNIFNNVPRSILSFGMFFALVFPLVLVILHTKSLKPTAGQKLKGFIAGVGDRKRIWYWLLPTYHLALPALMALLLRLPHKFPDVFPRDPETTYIAMSLLNGSGEFKEYCFAMAILIYVAVVYAKMGKKTSPALGGDV